ncbi:MAG: AbrB/MazE/SpoVT family DNA-binding domain-containing protein [Ardenticatenaceae bacterium]|nr:AbrB/MazE/SpoVT family DNA-binding domain-containing protein [Ardenticatenaceae bacterium]MCB8946226.1 AbrB/MazE/SpoVT family DNA-binding domain-containing protein [Ardenticatenaceae bacterium]
MTTTTTISNSQQFTAQIRQRGQLTIPQKLRDSLAMQDGDTVTLIQVGDNILVSPKSLRTFELADKLADMMAEEGVTLADILSDLPQIRQEIYREKYGDSGE